MLRSRATIFFIHVAGWMVFLGFPLLFMNRTQQSSHITFTVLLSPYYWLFCLIYILIFYLNSLYLVPQFVFRKRFIRYGLVITLLLGIVYFLQPYDNLLGHNLLKTPSFTQNGMVMRDSTMAVNGLDSSTANRKNLPFGPLPHQDLRMEDPSLKPSNHIIFIHQSGNIDLVALFILIIIIGLSIAVSTVQKWQVTEQLVVKTQAEKAHAELSFLKAQINPHFLFNTLNNIYALSVTDSQNTSESIMKLSNIMRYVTDEVTEDLVLLQSEVDCIKDYIDLQKLRLGKKTKLNFTISGAITNQKIAPLVLMTFIENVFKYGISKNKPTVIEIRLLADDSKLFFFCQNTIVEKESSIKRKGIGIANTRQRLEHLYPGKHQLEIKNENQLFTVTLSIDC